MELAIQSCAFLYDVWYEAFGVILIEWRSMTSYLEKQSSAPFEVFHFLPLYGVFVPHVVTYRIRMRESPGAFVDGANRAVTWVVYVNVLPNIDQRWQNSFAERTVVSGHGSSDVICNSTIQCAALPSIIHTNCLICCSGVIHFTHKMAVLHLNA